MVNSLVVDMIDEQTKKILEAVTNYWWQKVLDKMTSPPYPEFEEALEELKQEILNEIKAKP